MTAEELQQVVVAAIGANPKEIGVILVTWDPAKKGVNDVGLFTNMSTEATAEMLRQAAEQAADDETKFAEVKGPEVV